MATNRLVNTHFWDDGYIVTLDPTEKLIFLYLLTNPQTNIAGVYELQARRVAFDVGIDSEMVVKVLKRFEEAGKITYRDGWVCIHNWIKHQTASPQVKVGIERVLKSAPTWVCDTLPIGYGYPMNEVSIVSDILNLTKLNLTEPNPSDISNEISSGRNATRFPRKFAVSDEMRSWAKKKHPHIEIDPETDKFADYHRARGSKFKDWVAAWRNWIRKAAEFAPPEKPKREDYQSKCPY